jgi:hypothetical protein
MEELFGGSRPFDPGHTWQDREIRFDISTKEIDCRISEEIIETIVRLLFFTDQGLISTLGNMRPLKRILWKTQKATMGIKGSCMQPTFVSSGYLRRPSALTSR